MLPNKLTSMFPQCYVEETVVSHMVSEKNVTQDASKLSSSVKTPYSLNSTVLANCDKAKSPLEIIAKCNLN